MLKTLKFSGFEYNFFFVSDLHYGHNKDFIYTKRLNLVSKKLYSSVQEHDEGIINAWNNTCNKESIVFNLGDVCFNDSDGKNFKALMRRLNFAKHYILWGNHTSGHRQIYLEIMKAAFPEFIQEGDNGLEITHEIYPLAYNVDGNPDKQVIFVPSYIEVQINSTKLMLCHYPIISHNGVGKGFYHLAGHSHSSCPFTNAITGAGRRLDVGIESFGRPISLIEVKDHLKDRKIESFDHHNPNTT
jgi:calcineurin-like phosphoesterase family protein